MYVQYNIYILINYASLPVHCKLYVHWRTVFTILLTCIKVLVHVKDVSLFLTCPYFTYSVHIFCNFVLENTCIVKDVRQTDVNHCLRSPCQNGAICLSTDAGPLCDCRNIRFRGRHCEIGRYRHIIHIRLGQFVSKIWNWKKKYSLW